MDLNVLIEYIYDVVQSFLLIVFVWYNRKVTWQLYYLVLFQLFMTAGFVFNTYLFQIDPSNNVYPMNPFLHRYYLVDCGIDFLFLYVGRNERCSLELEAFIYHNRAFSRVRSKFVKSKR